MAILGIDVHFSVLRFINTNDNITTTGTIIIANKVMVELGSMIFAWSIASCTSRPKRFEISHCVESRVNTDVACYTDVNSGIVRKDEPEARRMPAATAIATAFFLPKEYLWQVG